MLKKCILSYVQSFFEIFSGSQLYNLINLNSLFWKHPLGFSETGCNMLVVVHVPTGLDWKMQIVSQETIIMFYLIITPHEHSVHSSPMFILYRCCPGIKLVSSTKTSSTTILLQTSIYSDTVSSQTTSGSEKSGLQWVYICIHWVRAGNNLGHTKYTGDFSPLWVLMMI